MEEGNDDNNGGSDDLDLEELISYVIGSVVLEDTSAGVEYGGSAMRIAQCLADSSQTSLISIGCPPGAKAFAKKNGIKTICMTEDHGKGPGDQYFHLGKSDYSKDMLKMAVPEFNTRHSNSIICSSVGCDELLRVGKIVKKMEGSVITRLDAIVPVEGLLTMAEITDVFVCSELEYEQQQGWDQLMSKKKRALVVRIDTRGSAGATTTFTNSVNWKATYSIRPETLNALCADYIPKGDGVKFVHKFDCQVADFFCGIFSGSMIYEVLTRINNCYQLTDCIDCYQHMQTMHWSSNVLQFCLVCTTLVRENGGEDPPEELVEAIMYSLRDDLTRLDGLKLRRIF